MEDGTRILFLLLFILALLYLYKYIQIEECPRGKRIDNTPIPKLRLASATKKRGRRKTPDYSQNIPFVIHQTNEKEMVPEGMVKAMNKIQEDNPEYDYRYYTNSDCQMFISKYFGPRVLFAYDSLIPGAYKADLFRYCVLYIKGGVYLDTCFDSIKSLREFISEKDTFISATDHNDGRKDIYNAFMCCVPRHPIVKTALDISLERIQNKDKGYNPLYITGPIALREAFVNVMGADAEEGNYPHGVKLYRFKSGRRCDSGIIRANGEEIFYTKYPTYRQEMKVYSTEEHYSKLWDKDRVFRE